MADSEQFGDRRCETLRRHESGPEIGLAFFLERGGALREFRTRHAGGLGHGLHLQRRVQIGREQRQLPPGDGEGLGRHGGQLNGQFHRAGLCFTIADHFIGQPGIKRIRALQESRESE